MVAVCHHEGVHERLGGPEDVAAAARSSQAGEARVPVPTVRGTPILALQRMAGNAAVAQMLAVQRDDAPDAGGGSDGGQTGPVTCAGTSGTNWNIPAPTTYAVSGSLNDAATTLAARDEAGKVTHQITDISLCPVASDNAGPVRVASVSISETTELPTWSDRGAAPPAAQAEWDRFLKVLTAHEKHHVDLDRAPLNNIHTKAIGKSEADANAAINTADTQANTDNTTYDNTTQHGITEGTTINPP